MTEQKSKRVIIVLGPPGSGKGTQVRFLQKKLGLERIGSGDLLRARNQVRDYTGIKIGKVINKGRRVPTPVIFYLWMREMEELKKKPRLKGFILDGSPRTVFEAEMLDLSLDWYDWNKHKNIIFINISPGESMRRLTRRRMCRKCGRIIPYLGELQKIKKCDKCGGTLFTRADDTLKGVKERLRWFKSEVVPVVNHYSKKRMALIKINGEQPIEDVSRDILKALKVSGTRLTPMVSQQSGC